MGKWHVFLSWSTCSSEFLFCSLLSARFQEVLSRCREQSRKREIHREQQRQKHGKENLFDAMCCRSKTLQSHDQRHFIILELHCSFNPSKRLCFMGWDEENNTDNTGVGNRTGMAVRSYWKCISLNVAYAFKVKESIKAPCELSWWVCRHDHAGSPCLVGVLGRWDADWNEAIFLIQNIKRDRHPGFPQIMLICWTQDVSWTVLHELKALVQIPWIRCSASFGCRKTKQKKDPQGSVLHWDQTAS